MRPDVEFESLGPLDQFHSVTRLLYPWQQVREWRYLDEDNREWEHAVASYWFRSVTGPNDPYRTFLDDVVFKPGVDREAGLRHVRHVIGSTLKHEWKIGGAAMLLQQWCERPDFERMQQVERENFERARAARIARGER